ncbi:hypothetical protein CFC21_022655 [Triticum aestivum]|uniref:Uncharacterized protein n=2 Tax=Triticum aestivum TaxID=4565 RepID=A0A9R1ECB5_WHEAT|nr:uncharacterized protein LOC123041056 [Triticum aestivum]KAF7007748.1 hypothetical protein CFC21_022655 [Triticum aestivum]
MDRRPPLAVSPRRLRPRPSYAAAARLPLASSFHIPSPGFSKKAQTSMRSSICALPPPSYLETSPRPKPDFTVAARAAGKENLCFNDDDEEAAPFNLADTSTDDWTAAVAPTSPLFERGRLYDLYSARRNERLKRKHGWYAAGEEEAGAMAEDPCVAVELSKRRGAKKAAAPESAVRRSMPAATAEFSQSHRAGGGLSAMRSSLRSSKEMKKPSAASSCATAAKPSAAKGRRVGAQSSVRRI